MKNDILDIDLSGLDNIELNELLATLESMDNVLNEQENLLRNGNNNEN